MTPGSMLVTIDETGNDLSITYIYRNPNSAAYTYNIPANTFYIYFTRIGTSTIQNPAVAFKLVSGHVIYLQDYSGSDSLGAYMKLLNSELDIQSIINNNPIE